MYNPTYELLAGRRRDRPRIGEPKSSPPVSTCKDALGGKLGVAESGLPSAIFIVIYTVNGQVLEPALWAALATAGVMTVYRIVRRGSLKYALGRHVRRCPLGLHRVAHWKRRELLPARPASGRAATPSSTWSPSSSGGRSSV